MLLIENISVSFLTRNVNCCVYEIFFNESKGKALHCHVTFLTTSNSLTMLLLPLFSVIATSWKVSSSIFQWDENKDAAKIQEPPEQNMNLVLSVLWSEAIKELHTELCEWRLCVTVYIMIVEMEPVIFILSLRNKFRP